MPQIINSKQLHLIILHKIKQAIIYYTQNVLQAHLKKIVNLVPTIVYSPMLIFPTSKYPLLIK